MAEAESFFRAWFEENKFKFSKPKETRNGGEDHEEEQDQNENSGNSKNNGNGKPITGGKGRGYR
ncbi:hypothetical protein J1N35_005611 [Gossypium stocksii]|uniref:Uncharacterized protein n=1 Tax=Gossypium stocksii TaxID=47602 RepID=A0A9D4AJF2_9ROSI|nr:hypothetical protein J1N35_005611 [Gossypium stocksii]